MIKDQVKEEKEKEEREARDEGRKPPRARALRVPRGYRLVSKIAEGGMATVYRAVQTALDRVVAVKVLSEKYASDPSYIERFLREAKLAATLSHPNIVSAIDVGERGGKYYFVMEFVEGESVMDLIARTGALPERRALEIVLQVAGALEHARRKGLIHRDMKPANILMDREGTAKLADMGLARKVSAPESSRQTSAGIIVGTPDYLSPEQARGEEDLDTRADIYSLGVTLFHMTTGRLPFEDKSPLTVIMKHLHEPAPRASDLNPAVSQGTTLILLKAMEKDRDLRYSTPAEMASDVEDVLRGEEPRLAFGHDPGGGPGRGPTSWRRGRFRRSPGAE